MVSGPLREAVLAASVLHDVDLAPRDDGVLAGEPGRQVLVTWAEVSAAVGAVPADEPAPRPDPDARTRVQRAAAAVARWMRVRVAAGADADALRRAARPVGLPRGHVLHPGAAWVREAVPGGALDVGLGLRGYGEDPEDVVVLPPALAAACGLDGAAAWDRAGRYLEEMAGYAQDRLRRSPSAPLRPLGDCDVPTLLAADSYRAALVEGSGPDLRTAAVPVRTLGWLDLARVDPAFAVAVVGLAPPEQRAFPRPLLVGRHEVAMARAGGRHADWALDRPRPRGRSRGR